MRPTFTAADAGSFAEAQINILTDRVERLERIKVGLEADLEAARKRIGEHEQQLGRYRSIASALLPLRDDVESLVEIGSPQWRAVKLTLDALWPPLKEVGR